MTIVSPALSAAVNGLQYKTPVRVSKLECLANTRVIDVIVADVDVSDVEVRELPPPSGVAVSVEAVNVERDELLECVPVTVPVAVL